MVEIKDKTFYGELLGAAMDGDTIKIKALLCELDRDKLERLSVVGVVLARLARIIWFEEIKNR